jgi:hypothetical protein
MAKSEFAAGNGASGSCRTTAARVDAGLVRLDGLPPSMPAAFFQMRAA